MGADKMSGLADIFGGGGGSKKPPPPPMKGEPDGDEAPVAGTDTGGDEPSESFRTAMGETGLELDDDQLGSLWRAIKACTEGY